MKALLVVGSAPCALEDLAAARKLYPSHEVMLVNGACTLVERAEHMLAGHTTKAKQFKWARQAAFPNAPMPRIHANWARPAPKKRPTDDRTPRREFPDVTDWWGPDVSSGATSAGKAAMIGLQMGFDVIVLCGCPMDGSGYHPAEGKVSQEAGMQRIGDPKMQQRSTIRRYRDKMASLALGMFKGKVFSMSGYTRQVLGEPPPAANPKLFDVAGWLS
jgi:hypothetical protein